jgi:hypothetical protein
MTTGSNSMALAVSASMLARTLVARPGSVTTSPDAREAAMA